MRLNRFLFAVFFVLLLLTVGEILYYFLFLKPTTKSLQPNSPLTTNQVPQTQNGGSLNTALQSPPSQDAILAYLNSKQSDVLTKSVLVQDYQGTITALDTKPTQLKTLDGQPFASPLRINLKSDSGQETNFGFSETDLQKVIIVKKDDPSNKLTVNDLKVGDVIALHTEKDLKKSLIDNIITEQITILSSK